MESKVVLGNSLLVPCVQELAKETMTTLPPRYLRPDLEQTTVPADGLEIPVIDMKSLLCDESMDSELAKLDYACKEWGFFQLVNHGVSSSLMEKTKTEIQDFFNLPMEEKQKFWQYQGEVEGFGQSFVVSEEQKLDWGDLFFMTSLPPHFRKPHLFPNLPLPLRDTLDSYSLELKTLSMTLLTNMMVTNGAYRSIEHRATVNCEIERLSIATFWSPRYDGEVGPAPSLISPEKPVLFKKLRVEEYFKGLFARELQGKSYLDTMRI
ncbi:Non-hem dioxygenase N-terminal domain - like 10 [Theobroma cacao]|nr:Non-hem dioxygenase N-terminal domain - like 10 [Theobroma cacao]